MNIVEHIIEAMLSALNRQPEAYTTVVYPTKGKALVLHDGLGISGERSWYEMPLVIENATIGVDNDPQLNLFDGDSYFFSAADEESQLIEFTDQCRTGSYTVVNPATGLPIFNGCTDVMGNPMGFNAHYLDDSGGFSCAGFDGIDRFHDVTDFSL